MRADVLQTETLRWRQLCLITGEVKIHQAYAVLVLMPFCAVSNSLPIGLPASLAVVLATLC